MPELLDDVIGFVEDALREKQADEARLITFQSALKEAQQNHEKVVLEKVARAKSEVFDVNLMEQTFRKLAKLSVINGASVPDLVSRIKANPNFVFPVMAKLAETLLTVPGDGEGISKESGRTLEDHDPDGWVAFAHGSEVKVRK